MSCSKDDGPGAIQQDQLVIAASLTEINQRDAVQFLVSAKNESITDAVIYISGVAISTYQHTFVEAGVYTIVAKKAGFKDSAEISITVNEELLDIYISGFEMVNGEQLATYWKNGVAHHLTDGTYNSDSYAIAVHDSDVYVLVYDGYAIKYWKNDVEHIVHNQPGQHAGLGDMLVSDNGDIYIAGDFYENGKSIARYWKNGVVTNLNHGNNFTYARAIAVSGSDVYVAGVSQVSNLQGNIPIAVYWKNGVAVPLSDGTLHSYVSKIAVSGNDVHVVGHEHDGTGNYSAMYWKNGVATRLPNSVDASDIFIVDNDVYIVGRGGKMKYWKNGVPIDIGEGSFVNGISVSNGNVYSAGSIYNDDLNEGQAVYWKNSTVIPLTDGTSNASASAITLVER
ncbi:MAG: hypothetical protein ABI295_06930 [Xanthomarina sp.]